MLLIETDPWTIFNTTVQTAIAVATLVISVVSLLQSKKIKELEVIAEEQKKQSEVLYKHFQLAFSSHTDKITPKFQTMPQPDKTGLYQKFRLIKAAATIDKIEFDSDVVAMQCDPNKQFNPGEEFSLRLMFPTSAEKGKANFKLYFTSDLGFRFFQAGTIIFRNHVLGKSVVQTNVTINLRDSAILDVH